MKGVSIANLIIYHFNPLYPVAESSHANITPSRVNLRLIHCSIRSALTYTHAMHYHGTHSTLHHTTIRQRKALLCLKYLTLALHTFSHSCSSVSMDNFFAGTNLGESRKISPPPIPPHTHKHERRWEKEKQNQPVEMEGCNLSVVSLEVSEVELVFEGLLLSRVPVREEERERVRCEAWTPLSLWKWLDGMKTVKKKVQCDAVGVKW